MVQQWLPSLSPDHTTPPNPRVLLPGMGEPDPLIPPPVPPPLPESQRRRFEAAALLTSSATTKKTAASVSGSAIASTTTASTTTIVRGPSHSPQLPPQSQALSSHEDFDDTCSDSV